MYVYHNANPRGRRVNDCTVRAISFATGRSWDHTYEELSKFAQAQAIMLDEVNYIDEFLERKFEKICGCKNKIDLTVGEFAKSHPIGTYLITMSGHITCCKNGVIYDTFDPRNRLVWGIYKVREP